MAVTGSGGTIIRFTADNDIYESGQKRLKIKGVRLVTASADSTAQIREGNDTGSIVCSLTALAKTSDESVICFIVDSGKLHVDLAGTGAEVFVYLE